MFLSSSSEAINSSLDLGNAINGSGFQSGVPNAESLIAFTESANRQTSNLSQVENSSVKKSELRDGGRGDHSFHLSKP